MFIEQEKQSTVTIEALHTSQPLDESLSSIALFLSECLANRVSVHASTLPVIEIGFLGIPGVTYTPTALQEHAGVYPIRVHHTTVLLGPLYFPHSGGPCPRCLERRWLANRSREEQKAFLKVQDVFATGPHPKLHMAALEALWFILERELYAGNADEAVSLASSENPVGNTGKFYALNLNSLEIKGHQLIADSSCEVCAVAEMTYAEPPALFQTERPKKEANRYRLVDPVDYRLPIEGYINHVCSALGTNAAPDLFHTITAPVTGVYHLQGSSSVNPVGWGGHTTRFQTSQRVGVLEGLERYCGHWSRTKAPTVFGSYSELASDALDPRTCGLYHPDVYKNAYKLVQFDPDMKITWTWGYSLRQQRPILIPEQLTYYFAQTAHELQFVNDTSNGCAIGSCLEEAILYGILELIERDNFLIHWYGKLSAPRLNPWSSRNIKTLRLLDRIERQGYAIHLLDTRLDLPFPTITAVAVRNDDDFGKLAVAAGAGIEPEDAIQSAICELAAYIPSLRERVLNEMDELRQLSQDFTKVRTIEQHTLLYGLPEMAARARFLYQNTTTRTVEEAYEQWHTQQPRHKDLRADLQFTIEQLFKLDIDPIVVDQTAPELQGTGLKVVRMIAPGLVPIDFGWDRHRLFGLPRMRTVPRTAGYLHEDFDVNLLNLDPHPFP